MLQHLQSSLGKKYVMAVSGLLLFGFVIIHMLGNLQIFLGEESLNTYAAFLKSKPAVLWGFRFGLLGIAVVHVTSAIQLSIENKKARPVAYAVRQPIGSTYASRTMLMSGLIVFVFVIYHLLHFTVAVPQANLLPKSAEMPNASFLDLHDAQGRHDVFRMVVLGYSNAWVSGFYILGMALLCLHLSHGVTSMFQSLGLKNERTGRFIDWFARASAAIIFLGNISIPIAILFGYGK